VVPAEEIRLCIRDLAGRTAREYHLPEHSASSNLDISGLPPGMYLLDLVSENRVVVRKLLIY
jgi:hypothetical protein